VLNRPFTRANWSPKFSTRKAPGVPYFQANLRVKEIFLEGEKKLTFLPPRDGGGSEASEHIPVSRMKRKMFMWNAELRSGKAIGVRLFRNGKSAHPGCDPLRPGMLPFIPEAATIVRSIDTQRVRCRRKTEGKTQTRLVPLPLSKLRPFQHKRPPIKPRLRLRLLGERLPLAP
jgi:hypothetical protein